MEIAHLLYCILFITVYAVESSFERWQLNCYLNFSITCTHLIFYDDDVTKVLS